MHLTADAVTGVVLEQAVTVLTHHALDRGVYIRSMAARGHLGGLASAAREAIRLIDASGRHHCLLETVGVGQSELEVMLTAAGTGHAHLRCHEQGNRMQLTFRR